MYKPIMHFFGVNKKLRYAGCCNEYYNTVYDLILLNTSSFLQWSTKKL